MVDSAHDSMPVESTTLYLIHEPRDGPHPPLNALVQALAGCTRFRFNFHPDSTTEEPHVKSVEFESLERARKAFALLNQHQIRTGPGYGDSCIVRLSGSDQPLQSKSNENVQAASPPAAGKLLNVTELPPELTVSEVYDVFVKFGPIYSCQLSLPGTCTLYFYDTAHADARQKEMNFANVGTYQISVRSPSRRETKDSWRGPRLFHSYNDKGGHQHPANKVWRRSSSSSTQGSHTLRNSGDGQHGWSIDQPVTSTPPTRRAVSDQLISKPASPDSITLAPFRGPLPPHPGMTSQAHLSRTSKHAPLSIQDPTRVIIEHLPEWIASSDELLRALNGVLQARTGHPTAPPVIVECNLAVDTQTLVSKRFAVVRVADKCYSQTLIDALDAQYLPRDRDGQQEPGKYDEDTKRPPLVARLFQPSIGAKKDFLSTPAKNGTACMNVQAPAFVPGATRASGVVAAANGSDTSTPSGSPERYRDDEKAAASTSSFFTPHAGGITDGGKRGSDDGSRISVLSDAQRSKYRKLLRLSLSEQSIESNQQEPIIGFLLRLPEEEVKRCIFEDAYLKRKILIVQELFLDDPNGLEKLQNDIRGLADTNDDPVHPRVNEGKEPVSPTASRVYDRKELLSLYSPKADNSPILREVATALASPNSTSPTSLSKGHSPSSRTSPSPSRQAKECATGQRSPTSIQAGFAHAHHPLPPRPSQGKQEKVLDLETLTRFSVKYIFELAESEDPPAILSKRDQARANEVERFLADIAELKSHQKKQKIGEKVFRLFKTQAPGMKNLSKRTVNLLDNEDLRALMHLCEEFPEVLIAKAATLAV